ncbi:beta-lactamase family protein [Ruminiclostridium herbifermentans]|uniref:Beta-lactamase family protein n=1 Tax=Ruminiclostridium herbifermentans TaxID=2488810 RepID=A0A4U7JF43_9FIRM|nr:serine hydrolase domain-containing protein [Ruminiclostridium herbifermentans]QNU67393.1 beta-lactamase family protein [Ruminiclostridium herbifermentans]
MMLKKFSLGVLTFLFTFSILFAGCTSESSSNKDTKTQLDDIISLYTGFNGSILVANGDEILLNNGYGKADYDKKIDNSPQTVFGIASITSQFTATAIMMLQEKNQLNIQDTINKYISDYPNGEKIKIYHLLTHTSGIPELYSLVESIEIGKHAYTSSEVIDLFKNKPLNFDIGAKYEFSNSNYALLGFIIEKVSGMKYEDFIEQNIFKPLNMNNSGFLSSSKSTDDKSGIADRAIGYKKLVANAAIFEEENAAESSNPYEKSFEAEPTLTYAAGGIYSTVEDLYKWNKALNTNKLITNESLKEMFTPHVENYGYGWFIDEKHAEDSHESDTSGDQSESSNSASSSIANDDNSKEAEIVHHGGYLPGYSSFIIRNNTTPYVVIILSNTEYEQRVMDMGYHLMDALEKE